MQNNTQPSTGRSVLVTGGNRGIGLAIALRAAADGANIAIMAKTAEPHPKLQGTVYTAADQLNAAGGKALPIIGDVRNDDDVARAVAETVERFGGIDIVLNNASAIDLRKTDDVTMKSYDLMADINARGTFMLSKFSLDALRRSENPHILTLSPPLNLDPKWAGNYLAYTMAKYGMSLTTLGLAEELKNDGIAARVINIHTIKPLDVEAIVASARKTRAVVTCEEHLFNGGLGDSVAQTLALHCPTPMEYVAVDDKFGESGTPDEMLTNYHLRAADIVEKVHAVLARK